MYRALVWSATHPITTRYLTVVIFLEILVGFAG